MPWFSRLLFRGRDSHRTRSTTHDLSLRSGTIPWARYRLRSSCGISDVWFQPVETRRRPSQIEAGWSLRFFDQHPPIHILGLTRASAAYSTLPWLNQHTGCALTEGGSINASNGIQLPVTLAYRVRSANPERVSWKHAGSPRVKSRAFSGRTECAGPVRMKMMP